MAYHLQSLVRVIELMLCHDTHKYFDNITTPQIESLLEKVCFLRDSFANHAILSQQQDSFEDQIRDATQHAEDVLETYATSFATRSSNMKKLLTKFAESRFACFATEEHNISLPDLQNLLENFDSLKEEMMKIYDGDHIPAVKESPPVASSTDRNLTSLLVGFKHNLSQLMERLFGDSSKLEIIPIVGMGGIGKTTLARRIYDDSAVVSHFDTRAWATVSDDYSLQDILLRLLGSKRDNTTRDLGLTLYQGLVGTRYLIVLDDIWRSKAWDDVKKWFPNGNNGSRIILTTRQSDVATYVDSNSPHHQVRPLDTVDSWELLRKKVFGDETCLPELEQLGKKIAKSCRGHPLAIQVIGGFLSQSERTKNSWEKVAGDVISTVANENEHVSNILSLSYDHLPYYVKPCFLYMSAFPEDFEIKASELIRLWISEGFLIPILGKSLEEVADELLNVFIDRNLIFIRNRTLRGRVKTLGIHDLLRDLCVLKAHDKKFSHVINERPDHNISQDMMCLRRVSVLNCSRVSVLNRSCVGDIDRQKRQKTFARSLLNFSSYDLEKLPRGSSRLQLLRVLRTGSREFPKDLRGTVNLRYLSFVCWRGLHPSITAFRNLQFLIIQGYKLKVPQELFEMAHLREIVSKEASEQSFAFLQCDFKESRNLVPQKNLHTVSKLIVSTNINLFLAKWPNLKKLGLGHLTESTLVVNISCLHKLEKLLIRDNPNLSHLSFPITLKSLTLECSSISEICMTTLSMLPNLEALKLIWISFLSSENEFTYNWKMSEGKFSRLKYLRLVMVSLVNWEGDETHFPILKHLEIISTELENLPSSIGDIPTLETIFVNSSGPAVAAWARKIQEEQLDNGNELLKVSFYGY